MMDQDESDDGSGERMTVERAVTLEELTDDELIQELINREKLLIVTVRRDFPMDAHDREGFLGAVLQALAKDTGLFLQQNGMLADDAEHNLKTNRIHYTMTSVVLRPKQESKS